MYAPRKVTSELTKRKNKGKKEPLPLILACRCHERGCGRNSGGSSPAPISFISFTAPSASAASLSSSRSQYSRSSHSDASLPSLSSASTFLPTSVALRKSSAAWLHLASARRSRIFHRLFHLPVSFHTSAHSIFCWAFCSGHSLKRCSRVWFWYRHHPALRGVPVLRPMEILPGQAASRLELVEPRGEPLSATSHRAVWLLAFWHSVLLLGDLPLDVSKRPREEHGPRLDPVRVASTPRVFGSSAAILAHSSALSFPEIPLWAGQHRISMMTPGRARRSVAMCFLTWSAYCWPGPGSLDTIRLMAARASVKIVNRSGVI